MTMLLGLDVEVDHALGRQVVQRRGDVQRERQQLLERQRRRRASSSSRSVGPSRCSSSRCGKRPSSTASNPRTTTGCASRASALGLAREVAQRGRVARLVGPQHLGDQHGEPVLVPDEEHLVAAAAAEPAQHGAAGRDLVALARSPRSAARGASTAARRDGRTSRGSSSRAAVVVVVRRRARPCAVSVAAGWSAGAHGDAARPSGAPSASTTAAAAAASDARRRALVGRGASSSARARKAPGEAAGERRRVDVGQRRRADLPAGRAPGNPRFTAGNDVLRRRSRRPCDPSRRPWRARPSSPRWSPSPWRRC